LPTERGGRAVRGCSRRQAAEWRRAGRHPPLRPGCCVGQPAARLMALLAPT
jgi:hypothetical protein